MSDGVYRWAKLDAAAEAAAEGETANLPRIDGASWWFQLRCPPFLKSSSYVHRRLASDQASV